MKNIETQSGKVYTNAAIKHQGKKKAQVQRTGREKNESCFGFNTIDWQFI